MAGARFGTRPAAHEDPTESAELARRIRAGDCAATTELIARYRAGLTILLRRLVKDSAFADDLVQEVFRIALEALQRDRINDSQKLAAYIWGIARNLAHTERRRRQRHPETTADELLIDSTMRPDEQLLHDERARLVRQAVAALAPRDRAVLREFYLNDTPKEMLCRRLLLTPAQFDVIKWRALKRLRPLLQTRGGRDD